MSGLNIFNGASVLVTGHNGFKGSWLSLWLMQLGAKVSGISLEIPSEPSHFDAANLREELNDYTVDIGNLSELKNIIKKVNPDFVFHLAAQALVRKSYSNPVETWHTNTMGSINLLESLRQINKPCTVVMITSDKCYDNVEWEWGYRETDKLGGPDPYSASKGAAELAIRSYIKSYFPQDGNIRISVGRAGNVIGGGDWAEDRIVPDCMRAWSKSGVVELRNPIATRPWQHVLEPLSGYLNLAIELQGNKQFHGEPFNFGPPAQQNHSVGELVCEMAEYWEQVRFKDVSDQYGGPYESGLLKLNCDKALHYLKWQAVWDFSQTVKSTVLWYKQYYENPEKSIKSFTLEQIQEYMEFAKKKSLPWVI